MIIQRRMRSSLDFRCARLPLNHDDHATEKTWISFSPPSRRAPGVRVLEVEGLFFEQIKCHGHHLVRRRFFGMIHFRSHLYCFEKSQSATGISSEYRGPGVRKPLQNLSVVTNHPRSSLACWPFIRALAAILRSFWNLYIITHQKMLHCKESVKL